MIIPPSGVLPVWLKEIKKHLDHEDKVFSWQIRFAHGDNRHKDTIGTRLTAKDERFLGVQKGELAHGWAFQGSNMICCTASKSMEGHLTSLFQDITYGPPNRYGQKGKARITYRPIRWGRIVGDEVHNESKEGTGTMKRINEIDGRMKEIGYPKARKWFLSGTPYEKSPAAMAGWIHLLEDQRWGEGYEGDEREVSYPRMAHAHANLQACTSQALKTMGQTHNALVRAAIDLGKSREKLDNGVSQLKSMKKAEVAQKELRTLRQQNQSLREDILEKDEAYRSKSEEYQQQLDVVVSIIWIRRTPDSKFFGHDLVTLPPHYHFDCLLNYPEEQVEQLTEAYYAITTRARENYEVEIAEHRRKPTGKEPKIKLET